MSSKANSAPHHIDHWERYGALVRNRQASLDFCTKLSSALAGKLSSNTRTIALAGSFGRLEAAPKTSDADYIVIVDDKNEAEADLRAVAEAVRSMGVQPPNPQGVFAVARTLAELVDKAGDPNEEMDVLGKRLLLLLESRAVYGETEYRAVMDRVLGKYEYYLRAESSKEFAFLINDLIRYFRFICVNYESSFWRDNEKWAMRNLKLRHSRVVMYAGLLFLLGEASKTRGEDKVKVVRDALALTPLERIAWVYAQNEDYGFFRVAGLYNVFLSRISEEDVRKKLNSLDYASRYAYPAFAELKANSDALIAELLRFIWERRRAWTDRFYEYLIF